MGSSQNDRTRLFTISDEYIKKLKQVEPRVQNNYRGNRLYCKTELKAQTIEDDINYYIPLSSAKESQKQIENASIFKLYGRDQTDYLGAIHINNMIPVPDKFACEWSPEGNTDQKYVFLVIKQAKYIKKNEDDILKSCELLYDSKTDQIDKEFFKKNRKEVMLYKRLMNDVAKLEQVSSRENRLQLNQSFSETEIE